MEPLGQGPVDDETRRVRAVYDRSAERYDSSSGGGYFLGDGREWLCSRAQGRTLEIGIGTGRNVVHYPPGVDLTGIDLSPAMLAIARRRAVEVGRTVLLEEGDATRLAHEDGSFDTVVFCLSLCSIPDHRKALTEAWRVLRRGGRLLALEHVRSPVALVRAIERLLEPLTLRFSVDHLLREPVDDVAATGFTIETVERSRLGIIERLSAVKPEE